MLKLKAPFDFFPCQVEKYMQHRLNQLGPGDDVGVFSYQLPDRPADGRPSPMPKMEESDHDDESSSDPAQEESDDEEEQAEGAAGEDSDEEDGLPEFGWALKKMRGQLHLLNPESTSLQPLLMPTPSENGKWDIKVIKGKQMLTQGKDAADWDTIECWEYYQHCSAAEASAAIGLNAKTTALKGMMVKGALPGQASSPLRSNNLFSKHMVRTKFSQIDFRI